MKFDTNLNFVNFKSYIESFFFTSTKEAKFLNFLVEVLDSKIFFYFFKKFKKIKKTKKIKKRKMKIFEKTS